MNDVNFKACIGTRWRPSLLGYFRVLYDAEQHILCATWLKWKNALLPKGQRIAQAFVVDVMPLRPADSDVPLFEVCESELAAAKRRLTLYAKESTDAFGDCLGDGKCTNQWSATVTSVATIAATCFIIWLFLRRG